MGHGNESRTAESPRRGGAEVRGTAGSLWRVARLRGSARYSTPRSRSRRMALDGWGGPRSDGSGADSEMSGSPGLTRTLRTVDLDLPGGRAGRGRFALCQRPPVTQLPDTAPLSRGSTTQQIRQCAKGRAMAYSIMPFARDHSTICADTRRVVKEYHLSYPNFHHPECRPPSHGIRPGPASAWKPAGA